MTQCSQKVEDIVNQSNNLSDGHFDSYRIKENAIAIQQTLKALHEPAKNRRAALEESLKFYKFRFELDAEIQWIKEHLPLACSDEISQDLHQAQILQKKHKKFESEINGHQSVIDSTLEQGQNLIIQEHPEHKQVCYF